MFFRCAANGMHGRHRTHPFGVWKFFVQPQISEAKVGTDSGGLDFPTSNFLHGKQQARNADERIGADFAIVRWH